MAHILFIYKQFPAPAVGHAGGEALFGLMQGLHRRGHQLTLVARILDAEHVHLPKIEALCEHIYTVPHHRSLSGPRPLALLKSYAALRQTTAQALREVHPDFVHVETTQTAVIVLGLHFSPASFRTQDVNWFLQQQQQRHRQGLGKWITQTKTLLFHVFEPWLWRRYNILLAISEGDRRLLAPHCAGRPLYLLPLSPSLHPQTNIVPAISAGPNLLFVGAMERNHNINGVLWFLDEVWPRIHKTIPAARFYIVGGQPPDIIRARADGKAIIVTGFVQDLAPWYRAATVFVSPLLIAGGLLQKVVDALAMGAPVVATNVCNHGLSATPGTHLLLAADPTDFAEAVIHLLRDPVAREQLSTAGQAFIQKHYDIEAALDTWNEGIRKELERKTREKS